MKTFFQCPVDGSYMSAEVSKGEILIQCHDFFDSYSATEWARIYTRAGITDVEQAEAYLLKIGVDKSEIDWSL